MIRKLLIDSRIFNNSYKKDIKTSMYLFMSYNIYIRIVYKEYQKK